MTLQQYITLTLYSQRMITSGVAAATRLLGIVAAANNASGVLQISDFYNDAVNNEDFNVKEDFRVWINVGGGEGGLAVGAGGDKCGWGWVTVVGAGGNKCGWVAVARAGGDKYGPGRRGGSGGGWGKRGS